MGPLKFFLGLDLGQCVDYTAIALLEWVEQAGEWDPAHFVWRKTTALRLRYLERVPLGTPYPEVVERVRWMVQRPEVAGRCEVMVDATGVGQAVGDEIDGPERRTLCCAGGRADGLVRRTGCPPDQDGRLEDAVRAFRQRRW